MEYINETFRSLHVGLPEDIQRHKLHGNFAEAIRLIDLRLKKPDLPQGLRNCLIVQRELISRVHLDYPFTRAQALERVRAHIPDFTEAEFDQRVDAGKIGWIYRNGEVFYFLRFYETLCKTEPEFARRAGVSLQSNESAADGSETIHRLDNCIRKIKERGQVSHHIRIRSSVRLKDEPFTPGMFLRVHLPVPSACEQQSDICIEEISPPGAFVAPEDAPQRTVCWEGHFAENTEFSVTYSYTHTAKYHDLTALCPADPDTEEYLREEPPHILFTPYLKELAATLTEGVSEPLEKARRIYDFITRNMSYTFMPAYFSLENIAESCARNFTGDCGVFALLFITLCRCAGVPAVWQSGMAAEPDFCGGHDWARFYAEPHGWLYADPSYGVSAQRAGNEERRQFYFGNLDPYRLVFNRAFQAPLMPDKNHWRADPYDNQVGEMETTDRGFRYDEFTRYRDILLYEEG